ncbi:hypothetical protein C6P40_002825 [Pichia californica]|uniref:Uncharacterized protein n=1 Tax=Pichia californica TaxID=460514 RepID=A0A9P6WNL3_9ASCO|nr:hypothetical protein C6P42_004489 [[Candida] californica]KAG0690450.1 hypothetical protein C6P40_002825 [[Candida] californica]
MDNGQRISVLIPAITDVGSYSLYDLEITIELNKYKIEKYRISKRFSDFLQLKKELELSGTNNLPDLPSKYSSFYKSKDSLKIQRKIGLTDFTNSILNNRNLRIQNEILDFFNIPKSVIVELNMLTNNDFNNSIGNNEKNINLNNIDSAQKWMELYKIVKSLLQDSRTKMFNKGNVVEIRKNLKTCENNINLLKNYLLNTDELGTGEIRRRKDLLSDVIKELTELNSMLLTLNFNQPSVYLPQSSSSTSSINSSNSNDLFKTTNSRRTFGKIKETQETKKLDNLGLFQTQKQEMKMQDQNLDSLRDMIQRQKQIGVAVNEELSIQNELLDSLNQEVDASTSKLKIAKNRVSKFL